jgi:hypothetical protein
MGRGHDRFCSRDAFASHEAFLSIQLCQKHYPYHFWIIRFLHILRSDESFNPWHRHQQKEFNICSDVTPLYHYRVPSNSIKLRPWTTWNWYSPDIIKLLRFNIGAIKDCNIHRHCLQSAVLIAMVLLRVLWNVWNFESSVICGLFCA